MTSSKNILSLNLGDSWGDGHGKHRSIIISTSYTNDKIVKAYKNGTKNLGFDFIEEVAANYEDSQLYKEQAEILVKNGIHIEDVDDIDDENEPYNLDENEYVQIYLNICKLGDKNFEYEFVKLDPIDIGGYGLFY